MDLIQAIVYGIVQGLTEWLPISSTAHLRVVPALLGWSDPGAAFTATIQLGTTLAVIIYFGRDLGHALSAWVRSLANPAIRDSVDARVGWGVFWGTLPIIVVGLTLRNQIETTFRSLFVVATALIVFGLVMLWADRKKVGQRDLAEIRVIDGIIIGLFQCLALIPGVSRSGSTMVGSFFRGLDRPTAARYSFLLSVPSIAGAGIYEAYKNRSEILHQQLAPVLVATLVAFIVGYASIAWFIGYIRRHRLDVFVIYRLIIGVAILGVVLAGLVPAEDVPVTGGNGAASSSAEAGP